MRLIDTTTLELHEFFSNFPLYAILSHTWGDDEVSFHEMSLPTRATKKGFIKIAKTCDIARSHGFMFAWVDTCCIDKSSSAELTEAINSMYQWYSNAVVCYVILEDLPIDGDIQESLAGCRWFSRGWTLQELIAPKYVEFYDAGWNYQGSRTDFLQSISSCTRVPADALEGILPPKSYSIAQRMSWAASRTTTRVEDMAYCLLGIFDVTMPLLYGEGLKAFRRFQEEIIKRNNDLTIFAWETPEGYKEDILGIFAPSPESFVDSKTVSFWNDFINFSATNKGLFISGDKPLRAIARVLDNEHSMYCLYLGVSELDEPFIKRGIYLRKIGPNLFYRDGRLPLASFKANSVAKMEILHVPDYCVLTDPLPYSTHGAIIVHSDFRQDALHVPLHESLTVIDAVPETLWDITDRTFLKPRPNTLNRYPMVLAIELEGKFQGKYLQLVAFCDYREEPPRCKLFWKSQFPRQEALVFPARNSGRSRSEAVFWTTLETEAPHILELSSKLEKRVGNELICVSAYF
ncbi:hypothetical protein IFR04_015945 [Cadophora malorum]|uniref:HET-domain-containing protein n=1 Tax=Cadophora malorum TaxID=108018 RepID=A0A8H7SWS5_9HELO|nr:hypothetical protein IFR04_015945 [Cadophora malorum]